MVPSPARLRRAASIVCYWRDSKLIFENYLTRSLISADPIVASLLDSFSEWRTPAQACSRASEFTPSSVESTLRQLTRRGFLVEEGSITARADARFQESWSPWLPAGGLLHFSTKNLPYVSDLGKSRRALLVHARREPAPPEVKQYPSAVRVQLPNPNTTGEFPQVLLARRTWREFSQRRLELEDLSTLLWLTCGVQYWVTLPGSIGRVALKTSPSAGARHPLEAYVAVLRVRGLRCGLYHYSSNSHSLELLRRGCRSRQFGSYLAGQSWYGSASALMFMTAVFKRNQWKYPDSAAYRTVILDAGHMCQTFCLTATWLGLAPFCTMALADSKVEKALGLDGISESAVYAAGVGTRPTKDWAPWPEPDIRLSKTRNFPVGKSRVSKVRPF
ncbi:MAG: SagB family peptide dehydrogenase [Candidatus Sulfotelmatobacter sp.]